MDELAKVGVASPLRDAIRRRKYGQVSTASTATVLTSAEVDAAGSWELAGRLESILRERSGQPILAPAETLPLIL